MGMFQSNIRITSKVQKAELLKRLRTNREEHIKIIQEARVGYIEHALVALLLRRDQLVAGKPVHLKFNQSPPASQAGIFDTVIAQVEATVDEHIVLQPDEFRQLWLNQWDWMHGFLTSNAAYSGTAAALSRGVDENGEDD